MTSAPDINLEPVILPGHDGPCRITLRGSTIASITPAENHTTPRWLALPGFVNLHAHADRAYTVTTFRPRSFADALAASGKARAAFTAADVQQRATRLLKRSVEHGVTRIRTHTDVDPVVGFKSMEGVLAAKADMAGRIDVDVIAFSTSRNDLATPEAVARLNTAVEMKPDFLGLSLNSSAEPARALSALLDIAERSGLPVDLHLDEHLEPAQALAAMVVEQVAARGLHGRVTFSHLCALATLDASNANTLIDSIARAGITVIALPETNLLLQDRGTGAPLRRGITLVRDLLAAGVSVRLGTDNVRDWFFPFGDGDMLDTALFASVATHLDDEAELVGSLCDGRRTLAPGDPADLVLIAADSVDDALARRPPGRIVFKAGRQTAGPELSGAMPS